MCKQLHKISLQMCYEEGNTDRGWIGMLIQAVGDLTSANANRGITCVCLRYSHITVH